MKKIALLCLIAVMASDALALPFWSGGGTSAGGGAVSLTSASNGIVVTPSPITGTGTVGDTTIINAQATTTPYTILSTDIDKLVTHSKSTAVAVTLPQAGSAGFESGKSFCDMNLGAGTVTITPTTSTLNGQAFVKLVTGQEICPVSDGANYQGIIGSIPVNTQAVALSSTHIVVNYALGPIITTTLDHTATSLVDVPSNPVDGALLTFVFTQDGTGSNIVTFNSGAGGYDLGAVGAPTLSTGAGKVDMVVFRYVASLGKWCLLGPALGF